MRTTTTALAVGASALAIPAAAQAQQADLRAPLAGHLTVASHMREHHTDLAQQRLIRKAWPIARRLAAVRDREFSPRRYRRALRDDSPARIAQRIRTLRSQLKAARRTKQRRERVSTPPHLAAIAACESGGNPATNTGNGFYGKYQFTLQTWQSVGGSGNPAAAGEAEQDRRAALLYAREGASPWPVCGR